LNLLETISNFIAPVSKVIDEVHTSDEERANLRNKLFSMQSALQIKVLEYEKNLLTKQSEIISAEALGNGLLQRNWRPITMLTFLILVVLDSFGWLANTLAPEAWVLLQIGLGGYVVGRSAEKLAKPISHAIKK
jgi:hypothetical protein